MLFFKIIVFGFLAASAGATLSCDKPAERSASSSKKQTTERGATNDDCNFLRLTDEGETDPIAEQEYPGAENFDSTDETSNDTADETSASDGEGRVSEEFDCGSTTNNNTDGKVWGAGLGLEGCAEEGKAWIGVHNTGPAACGDPLVSWCCSEANIVSKFPGYRDKLQEKFTANGSAGYKLYHCSQVGNEYKFHYGVAEGKGFRYKYISLTNTESGAAEPASCPLVTSEDLGIKAGVAEEDADVDIDEIPEIPDTVEGFSTDKEGLLKALKDDRLQDAFVEKDADVRDSEGNSPHGKVKVYMNPKLKDSFESDTFEVGSVAVAEKRDSDDEDIIKGWLAKMKIVDGEGKYSWAFYEISSGPDFTDDTPDTLAPGDADCAACHSTDDNDFISGPLPSER